MSEPRQIEVDLFAGSRRFENRRERVEIDVMREGLARNESDFQLYQELVINGLPAVVIGIELNREKPSHVITVLFSHRRDYGFESLTCEELAQVSDGDGHAWERASSLYDDFHVLQCLYCKARHVTGTPISRQEREEGERQVALLQSTLKASSFPA